jgi:formamidopyrimidine-DNA glycosylase
MPELPEVEAVTRKLRSQAAGARIAEVSIVRRRITLPDPPEQVEAALRNRRIAAVERRAKNILIRVDGGCAIHVHLRMTGNLFVIPDWRLRPAPLSAWMRFDDGRALVFQDPRGLGTLRLLDSAACESLDRKTGVEPLSRDFTPRVLIEMARTSKAPAKLFLMDQRRVAGLGNIYASEALFHARIHPGTPICDVSGAKLGRLHGAIVQVLRDAVESACTAYSRPGRFREAEAYSPAVYDHEGEPCLRCRRSIVRIQQGGRSTYFCPGCQR